MVGVTFFHLLVGDKKRESGAVGVALWYLRYMIWWWRDAVG